MIAQSEVIGVLELDQDDRVRDFTADEQALAQHLGNQIGVAIRLLDQRSVQEQLFRTEKMAAVGRLISGVVNELQTPLASHHQPGAQGAREGARGTGGARSFGHRRGGRQGRRHGHPPGFVRRGRTGGRASGGRQRPAAQPDRIPRRRLEGHRNPRARPDRRANRSTCWARRASWSRCSSTCLCTPSNRWPARSRSRSPSGPACWPSACWSRSRSPRPRNCASRRIWRRCWA